VGVDFHETPMPPRWPRVPDRNDADYRKLDDRMNFAVHVGIFSATNSGMWFLKTLWHANWDWTTNVTLGWLAIVLVHALYHFKLADYSETSDG
jgi:hypothetical protein